MSIPRRDPNFTMAELSKVGDAFLAAGLAYWEAAHKAGIDGAVIWLSDSDQGFVLYTRGEYRDVLLRNIPNQGNERSFGGAGENEAAS